MLLCLFVAKIRSYLDLSDTKTPYLESFKPVILPFPRQISPEDAWKPQALIHD